MSNICVRWLVVYGNGFCLYTSTFHPGAVSTTCILYMGTFWIYVYVVCHGLCRLYIVLHRGHVSLTTTALAGKNRLYPPCSSQSIPVRTAWVGNSSVSVCTAINNAVLSSPKLCVRESIFTVHASCPSQLELRYCSRIVRD